MILLLSQTLQNTDLKKFKNKDIRNAAEKAKKGIGVRLLRRSHVPTWLFFIQW